MKNKWQQYRATQITQRIDNNTKRRALETERSLWPSQLEGAEGHDAGHRVFALLALRWLSKVPRNKPHVDGAWRQQVGDPLR